MSVRGVLDVIQPLRNVDYQVFNLFCFIQFWVSYEAENLITIPVSPFTVFIVATRSAKKGARGERG